MLTDAGAAYVIVGHSERRADHGESDEAVRAKAQAAHRARLVAIICIGETLAQRDAGETLKVVSAQLRGSLPDDATAANTVVAYERSEEHTSELQSLMRISYAVFSL